MYKNIDIYQTITMHTAEHFLRLHLFVYTIRYNRGNDVMQSNEGSMKQAGIILDLQKTPFAIVPPGSPSATTSHFQLKG